MTYSNRETVDFSEFNDAAELRDFLNAMEGDLSVIYLESQTGRPVKIHLYDQPLSDGSIVRNMEVQS